MTKPSPEAKALSLFLMAFKKTNPNYNEKSKRINKQWGLVKSNKLSEEDYNSIVENMLGSLGGYSVVLEKTVKFYIDRTGKWTLEGDDQYCQDAQLVADKILKQRV